MQLDEELFIATMQQCIEPEMNDMLAQQEANADYRTERQEMMMGGLSWSYQD